MEIKKYKYLHEDVQRLREEVFMIEQGFKNEFDELDLKSTFITLYDNHQICACARYFKHEDKYYIGRICVSKEYRHQGIGTKLLKEVHKELGNVCEYVYLDAQVRAQKFYESLGYLPTNQYHDDEGVPHVLMYKKIH